MGTYAGTSQIGMIPAAGDARLLGCTAASGRTSSLSAWQLAGTAVVAKQAINATFDEMPDTDHRHRRPWGTS